MWYGFTATSPSSFLLLYLSNVSVCFYTYDEDDCCVSSEYSFVMYSIVSLWLKLLSSLQGRGKEEKKNKLAYKTLYKITDLKMF